jgi:hypothetical protein
MSKKFPYEGYIDYPGVGIIKDSDVYELIKRHSRFIDRLCGWKMTEMTLLGQTILMGIWPDCKPNDPSWTFYGKNSIRGKK